LVVGGLRRDLRRRAGHPGRSRLPGPPHPAPGRRPAARPVRGAGRCAKGGAGHPQRRSVAPPICHFPAERAPSGQRAAHRPRPAFGGGYSFALPACRTAATGTPGDSWARWVYYGAP
jgi:hypothetical protein